MSLVIDKSDKEALEKIAKADDRSVNYTINKAIKEYIKQNIGKFWFQESCRNLLPSVRISDEPRTFQKTVQRDNP